MIKKLLVANRGEIACRIIRTCKEKGIATVAIFSEADRNAPHVREADEAICIGEPPVSKSYRNVETVLQAALEAGVDAVHPGYGLLSEQPDFAAKVIAAGMIWIGPTPGVIAQMGDKAIARNKMEQAGIPIIPGSGVLQSLEKALAEAERIGYPVLLKASAGGGGMGMYLCQNKQDLQEQFALASQRAGLLFGDPTLFLEKYLPSVRHIEVQIVGDHQGNIIHLGERECSVQRRNQKLIEEAPANHLSPKIREKICQTAVLAGKAIGYQNVGTVEFLLSLDEKFYFLEMNTRLQVEHTVTEQVTGIDLVAWQLEIAAGNKLSRSQEEIEMRGHAMEFRICAEDPQTFYPSPGTITSWSLPKGREHRIDSGVKRGNAVSPYYDSLIAKWIVTGSNREETIRLAKSGLPQWRIEGIKSNLPLYERLLDHPTFCSGIYDTNLLKKL